VVQICASQSPELKTPIKKKKKKEGEMKLTDSEFS
jgi:hypothetical protein